LGIYPQFRRAAQERRIGMSVIPLKPTTKVSGEMSPETANWCSAQEKEDIQSGRRQSGVEPHQRA
jgi:hypothetical protein